jgi:chemotaxis protein CheX
MKIALYPTEQFVHETFPRTKPENKRLESDMTSACFDDGAATASSPSRGIHPLPQTLDLTQAEALRGDLTGLLGTGALLLDAAAVERMSTPCVQVLLAAGLAAEAASHPIQIVNASDAFRAAVADLGLQSRFSKWMA